MYNRSSTRKIRIGNVFIGNGEPIAIQSMTNTDTRDVKATVNQIKALEEAGCEIIRSTVPDMQAAEAFKEIKKEISIPLVADIHFDYRLAIAAIENGADKIRINPGNIGSEERVRKVVEKAKEYDVPIRVGVNSGSLEKDILKKQGKVTAEGLFESAKRNVELIEKFDYNNIVVSIKSSNAIMCADAYKLFAEEFDYPLHLGVTEAGTVFTGSVKSAVGLGIMLNYGIGDTLRVSLAGDPVNEIKTAKLILQSMNLLNSGIEVVACPTCGRTQIDLESLANKVEKLAENYKHLNIKIAVMGCVVNGPGEAKEADLGIAGGIGEGLLIKKGEVIRKIKEEDFIDTLKYELDNWK